MEFSNTKLVFILTVVSAFSLVQARGASEFKDATQCLSQLKSQVKAGKVAFTETGDETNDTLVREILRNYVGTGGDSVFFTAMKIKGEEGVQGLTSVRLFKRGGVETDLIESVQTTKKNSSNSIDVHVAYERKSEKSLALAFEQSFAVDEHCALKWRSTEVTRFDSDGAKTKVEKRSLFSDGPERVETGETVLPGKADLIDIQNVEYLAKNDLSRKYFFIDVRTPAATIARGKSTVIVAEDPISGRSEKAFRAPLTILKDGKQIMNGAVYSGASQTPAYFDFSGMITADISSDTFDRLALTFSSLTGNAEVEVAPGTFGKSDLKLQVTSNQNLSFPNMSAYWKITNGANHRFLLKSVPVTLPRASSPLLAENERAGNPYLRETPYLQVSNPQVQKMVSELKKDFHGDRLQMAQKILDLVHKKLVFDEQMAAQDSNRPLTTSEVLARRKGVCQHFSNLFTTLARGVGLPTRIILGFLMDDSEMVHHAWAEIEISPGTWLPVEPQALTLTAMAKQTYLPVSVSAILEDPNIDVAVASEATHLMSLSITVANAPRH